MKQILLFLYFACCILSSAFSQGVWTTQDSFPGMQRWAAAGFSIGTKGYVGTGAGNDFWQWDQSSNTWTQKAIYPGSSLSGGVGFSIGAKGYMGIGSTLTEL